MPERGGFSSVRPYEAIVIDGGSTDRSLAVLGEFGFECPSSRRPLPSRRLLRAPKGRASQLNRGAAQAGGDWLLFLHADTLLPTGAIQRLNELEAEVAVPAGGFMHQFSGSDWRLRMISFLDSFRCIRSRFIYGDQALFVRRILFTQLGGFPNQPIFQDVAFCERLIAVTDPRLLSPPVVTDARKFLKMGVWRSFIRVLLIILHIEFRLPVLPQKFFQDVR